MTTDPISRAISAYEHAAAEADRRAETHEALAGKDAGHALAARSLRSMAEAMRACADAIRPKNEYTIAMMEAVNRD